MSTKTDRLKNIIIMTNYPNEYSNKLLHIAIALFAIWFPLQMYKFLNLPNQQISKQTSNQKLLMTFSSDVCTNVKSCNVTESNYCEGTRINLHENHAMWGQHNIRVLQ